MRLTQLFVQRPTLCAVLLALVALIGTASWVTLVKQQTPNVDFPTVSVRLSYSGGSPTEIRDSIVKPIEDAIAGAPGLDHLTTSIQQGQASISATFLLSTDKTTDLVEVQRRVQSTRGVLPSDLTAPSIASFDPSEANVVTLSVASVSLTRAALSALLTNNIVPELEQVDGVANVGANGTVTPAIEVDVDPNKMSANNLTPSDVVSAISSNNVRVPGGIAYSENRETNVDVRGDVTDVPSVENLLLVGGATGNSTKTTGPSGVAAAQVGSRSGPSAGTTTVAVGSGSGSSALNAFSVSQRYLRVSDIANVIDDYEPQRTYSYVGGALGITLNVQKQSGASEVDVSNNVIAMLPRLEREYPQVAFTVINVQSDYSEQQIDAVLHTLFAAIAVTGLVMLLFLSSWRDAIVVLVAIPSSLGITLGIMKLAGFTIDTVSLLAMTLIIGILVDDSIVVLENIMRHFHDGEAPKTAAILGRTEIGNAAMVITMVDVVVFLPIAFLPGIVGRFLSEFALVVVAATLTSLAISFTVTPALSGNWSLYSKWKPPAPLRAFTRGFEWVRSIYVTRVLRFALRFPILIVVLSAALTIGSIALVPLGIVGFEFMPRVDRGEIFEQVDFPIGTPLVQTNEAIAKLSAEAAAQKGVQRVQGVAGVYSSSFGGSTALGSSGQIHVFLTQTIEGNTDRIAAILGGRAKREFPRAKINAVASTSSGGGNSQPIDYIVTSNDDQPEKYAQQVADALQATPGTSNVSGSLTSLSPQVDVQFDRERARALDVQISSAASAVRTAFGGSLATQFDTDFGTKYVQVIYPRADQTSVADINHVPVRAQNGSIVYVGDLSSLNFDPQPPLLSRTNRETVVHVGANVQTGVALSVVQNRFKAKLATMHFPAGVDVKPNAGGNQQNLSDTVGGVGTALTLSFLLVYLLMLALYDSYRLPFIIMFSIPVAAVGALGALAITNQTLNLFSMIGTVMLVGLVSKNGILIVELASEKCRAGADRVTAITESAMERFRPIVMTTSSMIAGMLPLALALDPGSNQRRALGIVVIGGLSSSLLLTLLLVPVIFVWFAPNFQREREKKSGKNGTTKPPAATALTGAQA